MEGWESPRAGQLASLHAAFMEHVQEGIAVAPLMFFTLVCGYQLYRLVKKDRIV